MSDAAPLTYGQAIGQLQDITRQARAAEDDYRVAVELAADAENVYRHEFAVAFRRLRGEGHAVAESETLARAECAVVRRDRDVAAGGVRLALERIENRRGERASWHRIVEWSQQKDRAA